MTIRATVDRLYRVLRPAGLVREWYGVLEGLDDLNKRLDPNYKTHTQEELLQAAREAAATGKKPGDAMTEALIAAAAQRVRRPV